MIMYNTNPSMNRMLLVIAFSKAMLHESTGVFKFTLLLSSSSSSFSTDIDNSCSTLELFFCNFSYKCSENDLMVTPAAYNSILMQISDLLKGIKIITFRLDSNVTEFERNVS
jgi:hypothetical protein